MKNFRIVDGDLTLNANGHLDVVRGADKLGQDLTLWTLEPLGLGYTTPSFGSILDTYTSSGQGRFIGQTITEQIMAEIQAEIDRLLNLYQANQMEHIKIAQIKGELSSYQKSEILNEILSITSGVPDEEHTAIVVKVQIRTAAGGVVDLLINAGEEGISITNSKTKGQERRIKVK